jgi:hypothetical protein
VDEVKRFRNKAKTAAYDKAYRATHPGERVAYDKTYYDLHKEARKAYYFSHREEIAVRNKIYRAAHKEKIAAQVKTYYAAHREEKAARDKIYHATHKEKCLAQSKAHHLRRYGLSRADFDALLDSQGGVCAVCKKADWNGRGPFVDHDHDTGKVRGIICNKCNTALGMIGDDPKIARAMGDYLEETKI